MSHAASAAARGPRIGVLTGGGDCPGLNAVIRAVTKSLIGQCDAQVIGIEDGFAGLMAETPRTRALDWAAVSGILSRGGTILGSSNRDDPTRDSAVLARTLANAGALGLQALVVIGGDGSMTIAHALAQQGLPIVGVPKTIDNDIEGCERSFGFDTAVATAAEALDRLQTTAQSHARVMLLETMGRHAGWIALEAGLAGAADVILLPELPHQVQAIAEVCERRAARQRYTVICVAEGARAAEDAAALAGASATRAATGSTPAPVGTADALRQALAPLLRSEVRSTVLGHLQRGGPPSAFDRVLATQFGHQAAQMVRAGRFNRMVSLQGARLVELPLEAVAHRTRRVPTDHALLAVARDIGVSLGQPG